MNPRSRNILTVVILVLVAALLLFLFFRWVIAQQPRNTAEVNQPATSQNKQKNEQRQAGDDGADYPLQLFFIVPKVGGEEACDNTPRSIIQNTQSKDSIRVALEKLFAIKDQYYGENKLYNSLHQSDLTIKNITHQGDRTVIDLSGEINLTGTCDPAFAESQIQQTVQAAARQQFDDNDYTVEINFGGKSLHEALGLR